MRYTVWDKGLQQSFRQSALTQQQRSFLEGVLQALEYGTYISDHVSTADSVVLTITRVHSAMDGYVKEGQPGRGLTTRLVTAALENVRAVRGDFSGPGAACIAEAERLLDEIKVHITTASDDVKKAWVTALHGCISPAASAVRAWMGPVWQGPPLAHEQLARMRGELAVSVALTGRDGLALRTDIVRLLSSGSPEVEALNKVLWPEHREFRVTMVVDGARRLEHLEQLLVGARQSPRTGAIEGIREVQTLTAEAVVSSPNQVTGSGAFVELRVQAVDAYAAISLARRQLSETLDQYAAGQRLLDFSIGPRSLAEDLIDGVRTQGDPLTASAKIAQPLTAHWPQALRPALRSAHLASRAEAPMTSAALAWSAIDSTGIKSDELGLLAKSCALQTTRQQVLGLYQTLADAVTVRLAGARWEVREYSRTLAKDERAIERTRGHQANAAQERHVLLTVLAEGKREHLIDLQTRLSQLQDDMLLPCATVRRNLLVSPIGDEPFNLSGFLEPNAWLDALLPPTGMASAQLLESQSAIGELGRIAGGLAQESLIVWRRRLSDPPALNAWLNCQESTFKELLEWLYVTRNSAFHSGQFVGPADELTAHAARGTVDLILEFLGNWHRAERPHNPTGTPVMDIFRELAKRNVDLRMALKSASSCHPLNIDTITGYGSDCWNRSLP